MFAARREAHPTWGSRHACNGIRGSGPGVAVTTGDAYVVGFDEIDATQVAFVGGKAAQLSELARIDGIRVPPGYCVTTAAFRRILADAPPVDALLDRLSQLTTD